MDCSGNKKKASKSYTFILIIFHDPIIKLMHSVLPKLLKKTADCLHRMLEKSLKTIRFGRLILITFFNS
jgi:hypothetical protein